jgi:hypothetical protein
VNCAALPVGPACRLRYRSQPHQSPKSEIAAGVAQQQSEISTYREVTGKLPNRKRPRAAPRS